MREAGVGSQNVTADFIPVIGIECRCMTNPNEIAALKAAFQGAVRSGEALAALRSQIEGLDERAAVAAGTLDDLARVTTAHAIASSALRGLVNTMIARRGAA